MLSAIGELLQGVRVRTISLERHTRSVLRPRELQSVMVRLGDRAAATLKRGRSSETMQKDTIRAGRIGASM
jgi:hypothetical protein